MSFNTGSRIEAVVALLTTWISTIYTVASTHLHVFISTKISTSFSTEVSNRMIVRIAQLGREDRPVICSPDEWILFRYLHSTAIVDII